MRTILSLDSSGNTVSIAILYNEKIITEYLELTNTQVETLAETIKNLFFKWKVSFSEVQAIVVNIGPGSYTGLRIGLATAQGYGLAIGCPVWGLEAMKVLAFQLSKINKRRQDLRIILPAYLSNLWVCDFKPNLQVKNELVKIKNEELDLDSNYLLGGYKTENTLAVNAKNLLEYTCYMLDNKSELKAPILLYF